jgi:hypothetical protein
MLKPKWVKWLVILSMVVVLSLAVVLTASAVGGAAFTTFNPSVDGFFKEVCKNSIINCNIYGAKEYVWLNGGPDANHLKPDGMYFFAVLEPGGQPNPNDRGSVPDKNLSDDYDSYTNRVFRIENGEVIEYTGTHWLDSGTRDACKTKGGCLPDGEPPFIRLFPYSDTTNPGGVYILAICSLEDGYPVNPRDCKYDAFKVKAGENTAEFELFGMKFLDVNTNGKYDDGEQGLKEWTITIKGTGFLGEVIDATAVTGVDGTWSFKKSYTYKTGTALVPAELTICEVLKDGWRQSYPSPDPCHKVTIQPSSYAAVYYLDFGNFYEKLDVDKTVVTYFERTHKWAIDKKVETEDGWTHNGYPKVWLYVDGRGDELVKWIVDVAYKGYDDSKHNVSGDITIKNSGNSDAVIKSVEDVLGGTLIDVSCKVDDVPVTFPYTLKVGKTMICTYAEDGKFEGDNKVTVTTEWDKYYATEPIVWGDPNKEYYKTVTIKDVSDLFGEKVLGQVTAPNGATFVYEYYFTWQEYGADKCGDYVYDNTATIVETKQSASATLKVNVQCYIYESAWAKGDLAASFCDNGFSNWGWTNPIGPGTYEMDLWAAAGQCDTTKGILVGTVTVVYGADGKVYVTYNVAFPFTYQDPRWYADDDMFPMLASGPTTAPGQYYDGSPFDGSEIYVIAHAVVGIPDPMFGPPIP